MTKDLLKVYMDATHHNLDQIVNDWAKGRIGDDILIEYFAQCARTLIKHTKNAGTMQ